jgi:hypothetical protein
MASSRAERSSSACSADSSGALEIEALLGEGSLDGADHAGYENAARRGRERRPGHGTCPKDEPLAAS